MSANQKPLHVLLVTPRYFPLMGGVEDKTRAPQGSADKRLLIRGIVVMGGVTIKN